MAAGCSDRQTEKCRTVVILRMYVDVDAADVVDAVYDRQLLVNILPRPYANVSTSR